MKYQIKIENENSFTKEMDKIFRKKAQEKLASIKNRIFGHITEIAHNMILEYQDKINNLKNNDNDSCNDTKLEEIIYKKETISI